MKGYKEVGGVNTCACLDDLTLHVYISDILTNCSLSFSKPPQTYKDCSLTCCFIGSSS